MRIWADNLMFRNFYNLPEIKVFLYYCMWYLYGKDA
jgi:hypothetical protein